ncbi:MAG: hypothetical protein A2675_03280 [Candidatus Yonathbacteria bacterium RIFCSPHIGHO2_01_FULL_51_10]|uniref:Uncharacterized protein n=1 Tax=Candidatus Yonathbacteria bacterium RIFCSPHIGHO2_01_FULL_51_10 TaxID=1802723 RepID=A0A1G2S9Q4_9BACT|nr:MAG: hypothetical protein A2675_03280 [Candidatus Yonathbacteria bacterium RIFCSPHIGHO2_01_FULL_51_10]
MEEKTVNALRWIVEILTKNEIPYRIGGGFAAHIYGSTRSINDIDVSLSGKYFSAIIPEVSNYITAGPKHYSNEKWDCDTLSLDYNGQEIDITDVDTLRMSNKEEIEWVQVKDTYRRFPGIMMSIEGVNVSLMDPRDLVAYKKHLGGDHQLVDIESVEKYIADKN